MPIRGRKGWVQPAVDEDGGVDFGAFATVDFTKRVPEFDKARYKVDKLKERLRDVLIMISIVSERLPKARRGVLKYLGVGVITIDQIENENMRALAKLYVKARGLQQQIHELQKARRERQRQLAVVPG